MLQHQAPGARHSQPEQGQNSSSQSIYMVTVIVSRIPVMAVMKEKVHGLCFYLYGRPRDTNGLIAQATEPAAAKSAAWQASPSPRPTARRLDGAVQDGTRADPMHLACEPSSHDLCMPKDFDVPRDASLRHHPTSGSIALAGMEVPESQHLLDSGALGNDEGASRRRGLSDGTRSASA
jgi:hypothetical protein